MPGSPLQVGITGGIGAGKSIICRIFSTLRIKQYNADLRARWLMENDEELISMLKSEFGNKTYHGDKLNRDFLAQAVFKNEEQLAKLNELVHPRVGIDYANWLRTNSGEVYVIKEAALLLESGSYKNLDFIVNVYSPFDLRIKRIQKRDPFRSRTEIESIISKQFSDEKRKEMVNDEIVNDESQSIILQVLDLDEKFRSMNL